MCHQHCLLILVAVFLIAIRLTVRFCKFTMGSCFKDKDTSEVHAADREYKCHIFKYKRVISNTKPQCQPLARSGHRVVADNKYLYSFGGYNPMIPPDYYRQQDYDEDEITDSHLFQELWRFNFATKEWHQFCMRDTLPLELASNAVLRLGNYLMVYGGTGSPFGTICSNSLYICSLTEDMSKMSEINTTGQLPIPQYGQALVYHNNFLYTIGGTTGYTYTCDIHRLNLSTKVWETVYICQGQKPHEPKGRYRHEVAFLGANIYILGGGTSEEVYGFRKLPSFNLDKCEWSVVRTYSHPNSVVQNRIPKARRCHGAVQVDDFVFICGGLDGEEIFNDLWRMDLNTFTWTLIETCVLPHPTYFHSTAVTPEGKLYIFGGIISNSTQPERNNWIYSTWLRVPKLSEMCWEALLQYRPKLVHSPIDKLADIGLPRHFINRIH